LLITPRPVLPGFNRKSDEKRKEEEMGRKKRDTGWNTRSDTNENRNINMSNQLP
jgi:hypothetical protein